VLHHGPIRRERLLSRRGLLGGGVAIAGATLFPSPAAAFWPAVVEGIEVLVSLWSGYKMIKEMYEEFFVGKSGTVTNEIGRIYGPSNFVINNYYRFNNQYGVRGLNDAEPGCDLYPPSAPNAAALCCGTQHVPVFLSTGCIVALHSATRDLRGTWGEGDVFAYTRPIRYVTPVEPWHQVDSYGIQLKSDVQYYSASGSVALRWLITDRNARVCRGEYLIRDDNSRRIVAQGSTSAFYY
jgi:hypothetical protein